MFTPFAFIQNPIVIPSGPTPPSPVTAIYVFGNFTAYSGSTYTRGVKLNASGSINTIFADPAINARTYSSTFEYGSTNQLFIGGDFTVVSGSNRGLQMARLDKTTGQRDATFDNFFGSYYPASPSAIHSLPSGDFIVAGGNGANIYGYALDKYGPLGYGQHRTTAEGWYASAFNGNIYSSITQSDGKIIVTGDFTTYGATTVNCIARLNTDGTLDTTFNIGSGLTIGNATYGTVGLSLDINSSGSIVVGGCFLYYSSSFQPCWNLAKINPNGTVDTDFQIVGMTGNFGADAYVENVKIRPWDNYVLCGGDIATINSVSTGYVSLVPTKTQGPGSSAPSRFGGAFNNWTQGGSIYQRRVERGIQIDNERNIYFANNFTNYSGSAVNRFVKTNVSGTIDTTFNIGTGFNNQVYTVLLNY